MPRCPAADQPLAGERRENLRLRRATRIRREVPLPRCHHRLEWVLTFWLGPRGFCSVLLEAVREGVTEVTLREERKPLSIISMLIK